MLYLLIAILFYYSKSVLGKKYKIINDHLNNAIQNLFQSPITICTHRSQRCNMTDKFVEESRLQQVGLLADQRLLGQDDLLGGGRIRGEQTPVYEAAIAKVWIVGILSGQ
jgi:hypothetical protein